MKNKYKINLFMFADASDVNAYMKTNTTKTGPYTVPESNKARHDYTDLSPQMKVYYDTDLIDLAGPNLVYSQFATKQPIPANRGRTIEWRGFVDLPEITTTLKEGVTPDGQSMSQFDITAQVHQYGSYVTFSDMLLMTGADKNISAANKKLAAQASLLYDKIDRDTVMGGFNVLYAGTRDDGTKKEGREELEAGDLFTVDLVYDAVNELARRNAPKIDGAYVCVLHPDVARDLMRSQDWKDMNKYTKPEKFEQGYIGEIDNCRFYISTNAKIWGPGKVKDAEGNDTGNSGIDDLAVYGCVFLADGAFGTTEISGGGMETIVKQLGSAGSADPLDQRSTVGWKGTKGSVVLVDDYIVRVECASSRGANAKTN